MTPEGIVKSQIRNMLRLMKIVHWNHAASALSPRGVPDIIGTLPPLGRALYIEVKAPGKKPSQLQMDFLTEQAGAGAIAFWADCPQTVVNVLAAHGFEPAKRIQGMFTGKSI